MIRTELHNEKLHRLLVDFYAVTGQRVGIFDVNFHIIMEYPVKHNPFCAMIRGREEGVRRCKDCDNRGMKEALHTGKTVSYRCHAGLWEVCSPLYDEDGIAGYIMFGQVLYNRAVDKQRRDVWEKCRELIPDETLFLKMFHQIRKIEPEFINATAHIMSACVEYIRWEQLIKSHREGLWGQMQYYMERHAFHPFTLSEMAADLCVSVSTLCKTAKLSTGKSVGKLVSQLRVERAKQYLMESDLAVSEIATLVGMEDYNYFSRLFRQTVGCSPSQYRQQEEESKMPIDDA